MTVSGCSEELAAEISQVLTLRSCSVSSNVHADINIKESGAAYEVEYLDSASLCQSWHDLVILSATLVVGAFVAKCPSENVLHSAGFIKNGSATLISGSPYAGKSNLTFHAWSRGYQILGDDWLFYDPGLPEVFPIPKPLSPRIVAKELGIYVAKCDSNPYHFGKLRDENRLMIGRSNGFYNSWEKPARIGEIVFIEKSQDEHSSIREIRAKQALPMLLAQTITRKADISLQGVKFAETIAKESIPFFQMKIGKDGFEQGFDLLSSV